MRKSFEGFTPMGPWLVTADEVPQPEQLSNRLWVNGELKQDGNTGRMTFTPEEQIEYLSSIVTLQPGDLIATGTPSGVGFGRGEYLKAGDVMEAEVEGLGRQRTPVVAEAPAHRAVVGGETT